MSWRCGEGGGLAGSMDPCINFGSRRRSGISFKLRTFYHRFPPKMEVDRPQGRSLDPVGNQTKIPWSYSPYLIDQATPACNVVLSLYLGRVYSLPATRQTLKYRSSPHWYLQQLLFISAGRRLDQLSWSPYWKNFHLKVAKRTKTQGYYRICRPIRRTYSPDKCELN